MAIYSRNLEWQNHNATRRYPLAQDATGQSEAVGGVSFEIPNDFLLSLYLSVPAGAGLTPYGFYIKSIGAYSTGYNVVVGYGTAAVAVALIARAAHTPGTVYRLNGIGDYLDCVGAITVGSLDSIDQQPAGKFDFTEAGGRLEVDCIRPNIRNVVSLRLQNGSSLSAPIYGDVILNAGRNARLTADLSGTDAVVTIDAIDGEGLTEECLCAAQDEGRTPIYTICGIPPTAEGDFTILGSECIVVNTIQNGLRIEDPCTEPCCGCPELVPITDALEALRVQIVSLEQLASNLEGRASTLDASLFASSIGDGGCRSC